MGVVAELLLVLLALGYVPEIDCQAILGRIGVDLYPYTLPMVELLEMDGSSQGHRSMELSVGGQSHSFRELLPHVLPQEFFAGSLQRVRRSFVDVGIAPLPVNGDEGVGDALQDVGDAL